MGSENHRERNEALMREVFPDMEKMAESICGMDCCSECGRKEDCGGFSAGKGKGVKKNSGMSPPFQFIGHRPRGGMMAAARAAGRIGASIMLLPHIFLEFRSRKGALQPPPP